MFRDFQKIYFTLGLLIWYSIWGYGSADITEIYVQPSGVMEKHVVLKLVWFLR